ncbi:hypothetical protein [Nocardia asiatica]|uniref:hypothetical protein n=1 Tax=Nocardia asiatica TaxID=209252 RepID=UPI0002FE0705|nr:hypothetical protein [Nocardia asiatica]
MTDNTELPAEWAVAGTTVYELHCGTRRGPEQPISRAATTIAHADSKRVVADNGGRYRVSDRSASGEHIRFYRDDPDSSARYFLLIGPNDPLRQ